jgi:hypothetical protein
VSKEAEQKSNKKIGRLQKIKRAWSTIVFFVTVMGSLLGGFLWVHNRLSEYQRRGEDILKLKENMNDALEESREQAAKLTKINQEIRQHIIEEFETRDEADKARDNRITAILYEMRARHGVIPLAEASSRRAQIREATERVEQREREALGTGPRESPLAGLNDLF